MARIRTIKHDFFLDDDLAAKSAHARLLFVGLWTLSDREGRLEDKPVRIKAQILPFEEVEVEPLLCELADGGFIQRYTVEGRNYIQVTNFQKHQRPNIREPESTFPAVPEQRRARARTCKNVQARACTLGREGNGEGEGKGMEVCTDPATPSSVPSPRPIPDPPILTFPVVGGKQSEWDLTGAKLSEYSESFPGVDVLAECRKARQWAIDNPTKRKTPAGMPAFLTRWLTGAQNRGGQFARGPTLATSAPGTNWLGDKPPPPIWEDKR